MPIFEARLNLAPEAIETAHELRGAMPLDEFLSYCVEFGIADVRDQFQAQQRDYLAQTMHSRMVQHQRISSHSETSIVTKLARKTDE